MPHAAVQCLSKGGQTPNELRVWLEEILRRYRNFQMDDWELLFDFEMEAAQMDPNDKNSSVLAMEVDPDTTADTKFWKGKTRYLTLRFKKGKQYPKSPIEAS